MNAEVDLSQLAIDRSDRADNGQIARPRRHLLTRYMLPGAVIVGAFGLVAWAAHDLLFPPRSVTVIPLIARQVDAEDEGTPLFKAAGWIEPRPTPVRIAALAPGVVDRLLVVEDQPVKAGEPIAELVKEDARLGHERAWADHALREAELLAARATLAAAKTRFEQPVHLEAALADAEADLAAVQTQLANVPFEIRRAEADLAFAKSNYEGKSAAGDAVKARATEEARSRYESVLALVDELGARVNSLEKERAASLRRRDALQKVLELRADERRAKDEAEADLQAAQARVKQAELAMQEAKLNLDRMTVRSTIDGRVLHLVAQPGSRLMFGGGHESSQDGSTVVTLYRPQMLQVRVDVRFDDLPRVRLGQSVSIQSPALPSSLTGRILFLGSEADIQKNTLQVKVAIDSPPSIVKPEMLVDVTFLAPKPRHTDAAGDRLRLFVPEGVVRRDDDGAFVWVADQSAGVARRTRIEIGAAGLDGLARVTQGLNVTTRIIASGHDNLRDGQRIRITAEANQGRQEAAAQ